MTGRAGQPPGAPDATRYVLIPDAQASRQADIVELILADYRRIGRLCQALYAAARYDDGPRPDWMLGHVWQRLADLLVAHTRAEEETCYLRLLGPGGQAAERMRDSIADHDDIRGTISEAAGQPVGSAAWWHTVRTVMAVSAEHLEHEERDVLPVWLPGWSMSRRKELGRQWCAFVGHGGRTPRSRRWTCATPALPAPNSSPDHCRPASTAVHACSARLCKSRINKLLIAVWSERSRALGAVRIGSDLDSWRMP